MKEIKTNYETGRQVIIWKWAKYWDVMPLALNPIINDWLIYGPEVSIKISTRKELNQFIKNHLNP
jgi:hypothetical protein